MFIRAGRQAPLAGLIHKLRQTQIYGNMQVHDHSRWLFESTSSECSVLVTGPSVSSRRRPHPARPCKRCTSLQSSPSSSSSSTEDPMLHIRKPRRPGGNLRLKCGTLGSNLPTCPRGQMGTNLLKSALSGNSAKVYVDSGQRRPPSPPPPPRSSSAWHRFRAQVS